MTAINALATREAAFLAATTAAYSASDGAVTGFANALHAIPHRRGKVRAGEGMTASRAVISIMVVAVAFGVVAAVTLGLV